jgi:hypothetical protein
MTARTRGRRICSVGRARTTEAPGLGALGPRGHAGREHRVVSGADFYARIWANQGGTGSSFRWIDRIWQGERQALCRAVAPPDVIDASAYALHPGLIEAACQVLHCCGDIETTTTVESGVTFVPFSVDVFELSRALPSHAEAWCHAQLARAGQGPGGRRPDHPHGDRGRGGDADGLPPAADHARCGRDGGLGDRALPSPVSGWTSEASLPAPVVQARCSSRRTWSPSCGGVAPS